MRWRRFIIPGCVVVAAAALLALLTYGVSNHTDTASIDAKVAARTYPVPPKYTEQLPMLGTSRTASLASYKGKVVVMNVYASWCAPCQAEAPLLASEQKVLAKHGATFVGVTYETSPGSAESFNHKYGVSYPVLRDVSGNFVRAFGTYAVPETFVINRQGKIAALRRYQLSRQWFTRTLMPIVDAQS